MTRALTIDVATTEAAVTVASPAVDITVGAPSLTLGLPGPPGPPGAPGVVNYSWHVVTDPATDVREDVERVMWVGGATQPTGMTVGDLWVKDAL